MEWTELYQYLRNIMKKELETVRQLLANLGLEEQFILRKENKYWGQMMEERDVLREELKKIQYDRIETINKLGALNHISHPTLELLFPTYEVDSWEILCLRDQTTALLERISLQASRNEMLTHWVKTEPPKKAKSAIVTLSREEFK